MKQINDKKGFTIIEVVLVLAIAGLIFMMVFLALPALQRSQRDTQRRNDIGIAGAAVTTFRTNNRGQAPAIVSCDGNGDGTFAGNGFCNYLNELSGDITLVQVIDFQAVPGDAADPTTTIRVMRRGVCPTIEGGEFTRAASNNQAAVFTTLESSNSIYCEDV